jgi:hypothetical protein
MFGYEGDNGTFELNSIRIEWNSNLIKVYEFPFLGEKEARKAVKRFHPCALEIIESAPKNISFQEFLEFYLKNTPNLYDEWRIEIIRAKDAPPKNAPPLKIQGEDFTLSLKWDHFQAYWPLSDFNRADPLYSVIVNKTLNATKKLYKLLAANPELIKGIAWKDFSKWLDKNKIPNETQHSVWR